MNEEAKAKLNSILSKSFDASSEDDWLFIKARWNYVSRRMKDKIVQFLKEKKEQKKK